MGNNALDPYSFSAFVIGFLIINIYDINRNSRKVNHLNYKPYITYRDFLNQVITCMRVVIIIVLFSGIKDFN